MVLSCRNNPYDRVDPPLPAGGHRRVLQIPLETLLSTLLPQVVLDSVYLRSKLTGWGRSWGEAFLIFLFFLFLVGLGRFKFGSRAAQDRSRSPQDSSRPPQDLSKTAQERPKTAQDRPKIAQDTPKSAEDRPKTAQDRSKTARGRPKTAPRQGFDGKRNRKRR